ncbi:GNAT family N-acetyltransferase [Auritidibacter sp. NML130574]|nr:GNAT family N-acetyltransferase [Auritidibacter sp. NML130574]PXA75415.1 N-acetyltransferase [Auritidibacter sp. NML120779]PXA81024.1 N-acetyltransferase [Auritidibacter sp. NML120636]
MLNVMAISSSLTDELVTNWLTGRARIRNHHLTSHGEIHAALRPAISDDATEDLWEYVIANTDDHVLNTVADEIKQHPTRRLIVASDLPAQPEPAEAAAQRLAEKTGLKAIGVGEKLMVTDMASHDVEEPVVPDEFIADVRRQDGWYSLSFITTDEHPTGPDHTAARGRVGVVGQHAVFDRIWTNPEFRRQGLGSLVMRYLGSLALEEAVEEGLLIAGADGQALYKHLGWTPLADVVVLAHPDVSDDHVQTHEHFQV